MQISDIIKVLLSKYTHIQPEHMNNTLDISKIGLGRYGIIEFIYDLEDMFEFEFPAEFWIVGFKQQYKTIGNLTTIVENLSDKNAKVV